MCNPPGSDRPTREQQQQDNGEEKLLLLRQLEHRATLSGFNPGIFTKSRRGTMRILREMGPAGPGLRALPLN